MDAIATTAYGMKIEPYKEEKSKFVTMTEKILDALEFNVGYIFMCTYLNFLKNFL